MITPEDVNDILAGADDAGTGQPPAAKAPAPPPPTPSPGPGPAPPPGPATVWHGPVGGASVLGSTTGALGRTSGAGARAASNAAISAQDEAIQALRDAGILPKPAKPQPTYGAWISFSQPTDVESEEFWDAWEAWSGRTFANALVDPAQHALGTSVMFAKLTEEQKIVLDRMMHMLQFFCSKCKWTLSTWEE